MKGKYHIVVQNKRLRYEFDIRRNITVIRGDSATGKTTLVNMIALAAEQGDGAGIEVTCARQCRTLPVSDWKLILSNVHETIIFLDENSAYIRSQEFAECVRASDNYFVLVTREDLPNLPYSVDEIYGIHSSGKYLDLKRTYNEFYRIYHFENADDTVFYPDAVITEDSNSGHDFFKGVTDGSHISCISANGKSNLLSELGKVTEKHVLGIGDGAAIGPEMNDLYLLMQRRPGIRLYLPESFEWMILKSGMIDGNYVEDVLEHPEDFIDSREYFSWEQFFERLLSEQTKDGYLRYSKSKLNPIYLHEKFRNAILAVMKYISFDRQPQSGA